MVLLLATGSLIAGVLPLCSQGLLAFYVGIHHWFRDTGICQLLVGILGQFACLVELLAEGIVIQTFISQGFLGFRLFPLGGLVVYLRLLWLLFDRFTFVLLQFGV